MLIWRDRPEGVHTATADGTTWSASCESIADGTTWSAIVKVMRRAGPCRAEAHRADGCASDADARAWCERVVAALSAT